MGRRVFGTIAPQDKRKDIMILSNNVTVNQNIPNYLKSCTRQDHMRNSTGVTALLEMLTVLAGFIPQD